MNKADGKQLLHGFYQCRERYRGIHFSQWNRPVSTFHVLYPLGNLLAERQHMRDYAEHKSLVYSLRHKCLDVASLME